MRKLVVVLGILAIVVTAGCGGGGGGTVAAVPTVSIAVPAGAAPAGVTPVVAYKSVAQLPDLTGNLFVAAAECTPAGTDFTSPVTLQFHLTAPLAVGAHPLLFKTDASDSWTQVSGMHPVTISEDRMTLSVDVSAFSDYLYYAIMNVPAP